MKSLVHISWGTDASWVCQLDWCFEKELSI